MVENWNSRDGREAACFSSAISFDICFSWTSMTFGSWHPNWFAPARTRSTCRSSSFVEKGFRLMAGMSFSTSASSRRRAARVLTSAAVSEPIEIFSAPFPGSLMELSISSYNLRVTSSKVGVLAAVENRFLNLIERGVPRYVGSGRLGRSLGPAVAWRFLALPASNSAKPVTAGRS